MATEPEERWQLAVRQFNAREFYDCHETLEELWLETDTQKDKDFYQGVLMIAVGCYHLLEKQNHHGAVKKLSQGLNRLEGLTEVELPEQINLGQFIKQSRQLLIEVEPLSNQQLSQFVQKDCPVI